MTLMGPQIYTLWAAAVSVSEGPSAAALWIAGVVALVGTGGLGVLVGAVLQHRRETARDKANATIAYAAELRQRLADLDEHSARQDQQIEGLWNARRADAVTIRQQGDFIDTLESHIWQGKPPPPPERPPGV